MYNLIRMEIRVVDEFNQLIYRYPRYVGGI